MNPLTLLGVLLFIGGILIFIFKLISYNRRKDGHERESSNLPSRRINFFQILAIIFIAMAVFIKLLLGD